LNRGALGGNTGAFIFMMQRVNLLSDLWNNFDTGKSKFTFIKKNNIQSPFSQRAFLSLNFEFCPRTRKINDFSLILVLSC
jgi:hypothetical protein